jgi:hypothetical protein
MYYDLIASLPRLPHFQRAGRLPITRLRLEQRLRLLKPAHADQLARARSVACWRLDRSRWTSDSALVDEAAAVMASSLDAALRQYVAFRMNQQTLIAALRRKQDGMAPLAAAAPPGAGPWVRHVRMHWEEPDFRLSHLFPWLSDAREHLAGGDARNLERLLMDVAWRELDRHAERNLFSFEAVFSYFFKWDVLQAWLSCDADQGTTRFRDLIDQVTHVEHN